MEASHNIWIERCNNVHDKVSRWETAQERRIAEAIVRAAYWHHNHIKLADRNTIFDTPLEERLKVPAKSLLEWHSQIKDTLKCAIQEYANHLKASSSDIPQFFKTLNARPRWSRRTRAVRWSSYGTRPAQQLRAVPNQKTNRRSRSTPREPTQPLQEPDQLHQPRHLHSDDNYPTWKQVSASQTSPNTQ